MVGGGTEFAQYGIDETTKFVTSQSPDPITRTFNSNLDLFKFSAFSRISTNLSGILLSASLRFDGSNYNQAMSQIWNQPTVSLSASVPVSRNLFFNMNAGQFHQLPSYSILGFRGANNELVNQNRVEYIRNQMLAFDCVCILLCFD
jgi:hypothetical protein